MSQQIDDEFEDVDGASVVRPEPAYDAIEHDLDDDDSSYIDISTEEWQDHETIEEDQDSYDPEIAMAAAAGGAAVGAAAMADDGEPKKGLFGKLMGGRKKKDKPTLAADAEDAPLRKKKKKTPVAVYATVGAVGLVLVGAFVGQDHIAALIKGSSPQVALPPGKALPGAVGQQAGLPQGKPLPAAVGQQPGALPPLDQSPGSDTAALDPFAAPPMAGSSGFESVASAPATSVPMGVGPLSTGDAVGNLDTALLAPTAAPAQGGNVPGDGGNAFASAVQMDPFAAQGQMPAAQPGEPLFADAPVSPIAASTDPLAPAMVVSSGAGAPAVVDAGRVDVVNAAAVDLDAALARINGNVDGLRGDVISGFDGQKVALGEIAASLNKLGSTLEEIKTNTAKPAAKAAQQAPKKPAPQAAKKPTQSTAKAPAKPVAAKPMIAPEKKPALAQAQANLQTSAGKAPQFVVRAATRGKAWISSSSAGTDLREIASGATLDGWGKVMTIRQTVGGKWEIVTERGIAGVSS